MQSKTTRAFRTISEAAEELDLQPHVLRFWESKFPSFKPIKRGGGRRFYRPEDIEFLRGIKILLHDERHPIKDVQKLIRVKGAARVVELGRSIKKASIPKDVKDTVLVPEYVQGTPQKSCVSSFAWGELARLLLGVSVTVVEVVVVAAAVVVVDSSIPVMGGSPS